MKEKRVLFIAAVFVLASGFTWPWDAQKQAEQKKMESSGRKAADANDWPLEEETPEISGSVSGKNKKKSAEQLKKEEKEAAIAVARAVRQETIMGNLRRQQQAQQVIVPSRIIQPPVQDQQVMKIQRQVQEAVKLNDVLEAAKAREAAEIFRFQQQLKTPQTLLRNPQLPPALPRNLTATDAQEILRQERIRQVSQQVQPPQRITPLEKVRRNNY